jgi:ATP-dependent Clp protease ATP-binding subunit ClpB
MKALSIAHSEDELFDRTKEEVLQLLKTSMRPEFLNRIDETIMFTPLRKSEIASIVGMQLHFVNEKLSKSNIQLRFTPDALHYLSEKGYDPQFGARPVKRVIQKEVLNALSKQLLSGELENQADLVMDVFNDHIVFRHPIENEELISF